MAANGLGGLAARRMDATSNLGFGGCAASTEMPRTASAVRITTSPETDSLNGARRQLLLPVAADLVVAAQR